MISFLTAVRRSAILSVAGAACACVLGCAANQSGYAPAQARAASAAELSAPVSGAPARSDRRRLEELWQRRTHDKFGSDFTLGPGDVLEISVPLEQLQHREVRVSPQDTIQLPLAGAMSVKGMDEGALTEALRQRLGRYMYDPPVSLFVKHYGSREVAVVGAVKQPGLYTLTSGADTLMDMIDRAGGMTTEAAAKIVFVPADTAGKALQRASLVDAARVSDGEAPTADSGSPGSADDAETHGGPPAEQRRRAGGADGRVGAVAPADAASPRGSHDAAASLLGAAVAKLRPVTINMARAGMQQYLSMPARPGDVLIIPAAGEVTVGGWVQNPGAYRITPGMTALSAVSAAGGALFSTRGEILRTAPDGQRLSIPFSITDVQSGEQADAPVQSGDVVMVDRTLAGAVPYAMYEIFTKFGTGMYLPVP